eukprot:4876550-Amphidinium_carterae.1
MSHQTPKVESRSTRYKSFLRNNWSIQDASNEKTILTLTYRLTRIEQICYFLELQCDALEIGTVDKHGKKGL